MRNLPTTQRRSVPPPGSNLAELRPLVGAPAAMGWMFIGFMLADLIAGALHVTGLTGFAFAAGAAAAALFTRPRQLLPVVTTPPAIFLGAVTCAELISMHMNHVAPSPGLLAANVYLTLATSATWLFGGMAAALVIACARGLPRCIRDLRRQIRSGAITTSQGPLPRPPQAMPGRAPERGDRRAIR
jgi:Domain of unknown function (DUF6542)